MASLRRTLSAAPSALAGATLGLVLSLTLSLALAAPAHAENLGAALVGKAGYEFDADPQASAALKTLLGKEYKRFSDRIIVAGPVEKARGLVFGAGCKPHDCGTNEAAYAFDDAGRAYASITTGGKTKFYGDPPKEIAAKITPKRD